MKNKLLSIAVLVLVAAILVVAGVNLVESEKQKRLPSYVIAVVPVDDDATTKRVYEPFVAYLAEKLGRNVELMTASDYTAVVEAMKYGHADMARLGPLTYVLARQEAEIEPVCVGIKKATGMPYYHSMIVGRPDLETLEGATFSYVDMASMSGYMAPSIYIKNAGIELGEILFAGNHPAIIQVVKNGSVDAGAVADNRYREAIRNNVIAEGDFKVFWVSEHMYSSVWTIRRELGPEVQAQFTEAMLAMSEELAFGIGSEEIGFTKITDADYQFAYDAYEESQEKP